MKQKVLMTFIILALLASMILFASKASQGGFGPPFNLFVFLLIIRYAALWSAFLLILLRLVNVWKTRRHIVYLLIGSINVVLGCLMLAWCQIHPESAPLLNMVFINLIIGLLILGDIFLLK